MSKGDLSPSNDDRANAERTKDEPASDERDRQVLLIVDDEPGMVKYIVSVAADLGHEAIGAVGVHEFMALYAEVRPDGIIMDIVMPDMDGIQLSKWLGEEGCTAPVLLVSGYDPTYGRMLTDVAEAGGVHIVGQLSKPLDIEALERGIGKLLAAGRTAADQRSERQA